MFFRAWLLSEHGKGMNYAHVKCILVNENRNNWTMMTGVNEVLTQSYIYKLVFLMNVDNCAWKLVAQAICVYTFSSAGWLAPGSAIKVLVHTQRSLTRSSTPSCVKWKRQPLSMCVCYTCSKHLKGNVNNPKFKPQWHTKSDKRQTKCSIQNWKFSL